MQGKSIEMRVFRCGWTAFMVVATSLPYLLFWFHTPPGYHYTWILPPYPEDSFAYMAWSQQAAHGKLLFQLKYTALPHAAFLFQPFFLICGWISRLFACNIGVVHWLMKAGGVVLFFTAFYRYTDYLGLSGFPSVVASILVGISSGVGELFASFGFVNNWQNLPADLWNPEVSTYWSLLWNPLLPYSLALILLSVYWLDRGTHDARSTDLWRAGFATGILALIRPYALPMLFAYAVIVTVARSGVPGKSCTSGGKANWYERSLVCHEERSMRRNRS